MNLKLTAYKDPSKEWPMPFFLMRVSAGFPSPAQDYVEQTLDLNKLCVAHPASTYFVQVDGDSMIDAGISTGDILVVDRSLEAVHGDVVVVSLDGEFTVKELQLKPKLRLYPHNQAYKPIELKELTTLEIFGVVTHAIKKIR